MEQEPTGASAGLDVLRSERGWQLGGAGSWTLGGDPRKPRLVAFSEPTHETFLTLLPPLEGPLVETWQIPEFWEPVIRAHGGDVAYVPLNDAYSTCSGCGCPLVEERNVQSCPSCGLTVETAAPEAEAKVLHVGAARFGNAEDGASAAVAVSAPFRAWLSALTAFGA